MVISCIQSLRLRKDKNTNTIYNITLEKIEDKTWKIFVGFKKIKCLKIISFI